METYNPATNTWSRLANLPQPRLDATGTTINNKFYVAGGRHFFDGGEAPGHQHRTLYVYDPATNLWSRKADMPMTTYGGSAFTVNGLLYKLWPTCSYKDCPLSPHTQRFLFSYNPATDRWTRRASPPHTPGDGALIDGKFYVLGLTKFYTRVNAYDPATDTWIQMPKAPFAHSADAAVAAIGKKLYVMDGASGRVDRFDPVTKQWTLATPLLTTGFPYRRAVRITVGGVPRLFAPGSNSASGGQPMSAVNEMFTP